MDGTDLFIFISLCLLTAFLMFVAVGLAGAMLGWWS
jgi:hypothetical protein